MNFTDKHAREINQYLADKPKGKFGHHRYSPAEWGFDADKLREGLAAYMQQFNVASEG